MLRNISTHAAAALLGAALAAWGTNYLSNLKETATTATASAAAARADLRQEQKTGASERAHAQDTQENSDEFTLSQPVRDSIARADLARSERLRLGAEQRAATYRAMSEASAVACRDLADRHEALDRHVVEGVAVVGALRSDLVRRDAEVKLLRRQVDVERALAGD